jgi:hypothetical protein
MHIKIKENIKYELKKISCIKILLVTRSVAMKLSVYDDLKEFACVV